MVNRHKHDPVYVISVAAQLADMHPQTLRQYDRMGLVVPARHCLVTVFPLRAFAVSSSLKKKSKSYAIR